MTYDWIIGFGQNNIFKTQYILSNLQGKGSFGEN